MNEESWQDDEFEDFYVTPKPALVFLLGLGLVNLLGALGMFCYSVAQGGIVAFLGMVAAVFWGATGFPSILAATGTPPASRHALLSKAVPAVLMALVPYGILLSWVLRR